jgi:hypothetical protein
VPEAVTVIANHLRSLDGVDDPSDGPRVRAKRRAQAEFLANLIQARQVQDPNERIISVGDYNAYQFNDGYVDVIGTVKGTPTPSDQVVLASADLVTPDLTDLVDLAPADQRYSFMFDGDAQELDHLLVTSNVLPLWRQIAWGRTNADFPESVRADFTRPERLSDHDPVVAYFRLRAKSSTVLSTQTHVVRAGDPLAIVAAVTSTVGPAADGSVTFREGSTVLGTVDVANGQATLTIASLAPGVHSITSTYNGSDTLGSSLSGSVWIAVMTGTPRN